MPRAEFDRELRLLQDDLLLMGSMVEKAIVRAVDALKRRDLDESRRVVDEDDAINRKRFQIEKQVISLIAAQQPIAGDLRRLIVTSHVAVELERIGDYAEGISRISLQMGDEPPLKPLVDIPRMTDLATDMLRRSLDALVNQDIVSSHAVCDDDDKVDEIYSQLHHELIQMMISDPSAVERATYLIWVTHDLERIADRATNIAEQVIYMVTGEMVEINVSTY